MNVYSGFVRREEMVELQRMLSEHVNLNDALKKKNIELEDEVKDLLDWQEELTQNAKEAEKDFNVKHRLWTEENSLLQNRNRALSDERDKKDKEVSDAKDQLQIAQQTAQRAEEQLNQVTIAYREIRGTHEGLPDRYEAAKQAAKEASESLAARDATIQSLQGQLFAKQAELDALSGSTESRTGQLLKALDAEQQRHEKEMSEAHRRWEENLAKVQGDKVMAEACAEQIKAELQDLQKRFNLMQAEVHTRDERAGSQIKQLEADVAKQVEAVAQAQSALKSAQEDLAKQRAVVVDAEAAMKAAQAEAAAAAEKMKIEKETGAEYTEEAIRAVTAADVQLQQAKERDEELARREKQIGAREALVQQELQQREQALDGQLKEMEDAAAARVKEAEEQVGAVIEKEREAMKKASSEDQRQLQADLDASRQRCSELQQQIASLKQELSEAAAATAEKENAMDVDGEAENGAVNERHSGLQEKEAELKRSVRELERRSEKLQNEVKNAAAAKEELTRLRKDVRDVSSQKGELENLVRELQKEEFALRTRITGAKAAHTAAPLGNSGRKHDSVPAAAGSGPVLSVPFRSPALPAAAVLANAGRGKKNGANVSEQEELLLSPGDGAAKSNNTPLSNAEPSQNQLSTPASKGSGLFGGLLSKAAGIFGGSAMPNSGNTPGLLADSVERIPVDAGAAQAGTAAVEFSPPGGPEIVCTPRIGSGVGARTSANAAAKQQNQRAQQAGAAADPARPADVSPEGTARLAARAKAAADAAAGKAGGEGADAGVPNTRKGAQGSSAARSIPKRPLSGSKRRRGVEEIPAPEQVEADVQDIEAAEAEPAAAPEPTASELRTSKLNNLAGALAGNTSTVGKATRGAKSGIGKGISAADGATDRTRKRVTHKSAKDTASAGQPAATAARASQRKAAMSAAATPRGDSGAAQQDITPPKIGTGAAAATRGGATAADRRRKRAAGDDAKSGTTSVSKSGISAGLRRTASKEPVSKRRAVARDGNGAGTSATAVASTSGANDRASGWKGKPLQIPKSPDAEEPANYGEANEGDDGENPSTPHHMSVRVQHLVEEAAAYTGYSPAELVNEDGQLISARALRAASRAQSRSTMTPGKGVEDGEEAEGGAANLPTPRTRRTGLRTRRRSLHDIEENEEELRAGEEDAE